MTIGGINSGLQGVQRGLQDASQAAQDIAASGTTEDLDPADVAESLVQLKQAEQQVEASAQVLKTEDDILGSLLDIRA